MKHPFIHYCIWCWLTRRRISARHQLVSPFQCTARSSAFISSTRVSTRATCYSYYASRQATARVAMTSDLGTEQRRQPKLASGDKDSEQTERCRTRRPNHWYRQFLLLGLKSAVGEVGRYLEIKQTKGKELSAASRGLDNRRRAQALQSQLGPLVDLVLSSHPDKVNAEAMGNFLDRSQEESGTGATLALALLDMGWSMPARIRPKLGDRVFAAVYEALRRYGLFTRYGALHPPDERLPTVEMEPQRFDASMLESPVFKALEFGTSAASASIGILVVGFVFFVCASLSGDVTMTTYAFLFMSALIFEREVLNGAVFNELVNLLRPGLADVASVHEAGHVAMSYLVGCPISTYSLGGLASLKHGADMGSRASCTVIDPELAIARQSFPDESLAWTMDTIEPPSAGSVARDALLTQRVPRKLTPGDESDAQLLEVEPLAAMEGGDAGRDESSKMEPDPGQYTMVNRFALSAMGGTVGETLVNGFGMGGRQDQLDLRYTLKSLWPSIPVSDIENTRKWAITVGLDVLRDDREAIQLLARNMRETRGLGRLFLDLEASLTRSDYSCTSQVEKT
ncbi:unnamed protein product [Ascophyllum nodosum]